MIVWDNPVRVGEWVCERLGGHFHLDEATAIGYERDGKLIAGVTFDNFNNRSISLHIAGEGNWVTRGFLRACFGYAFNQLRVNKALAFVDSTNLKSRTLCEQLGFCLATTIADAGWTGDLLIFSMTPQQCRWIGAK